jgi:hypothetical protein
MASSHSGLSMAIKRLIRIYAYSMGGIEAIWGFIKDKCGNPRWHEVIRLLIGSLERDESQRFVLERITPSIGDSDFQERALLAGRCMVDRVAPAEEMASSILRAVIMTAIQADSTDILQKPLRQLSLLGERGGDSKESIATEVSRLFQEETLREHLELVLAAVGWSDRDICVCRSALIKQEKGVGRLFGLLLAEEPSGNYAFTEKERDRLWFKQCAFIVDRDFMGSMTFLALGAATSGDRLDASIQSFEYFIISSIDPVILFLPLVAHAISFELENHSPASRTGIDLAETAQRELSRDPARALDRVLDPTRAWDSAFRMHTWSWERPKSAINSYPSIIEMICETLELSPKSLWCEALRVRFLPRVPARITLTNPNVWHRTLPAFRNNVATAADCSSAAAQLLLDVWLYVTDAISLREESPFAALASLTRQSTVAELRIAHCIRDLAYGDNSRADDLRAMVESDDPELVRVFRRACWID